MKWSVVSSGSAGSPYIHKHQNLTVNTPLVIFNLVLKSEAIFHILDKGIYTRSGVWSPIFMCFGKQMEKAKIRVMFSEKSCQQKPLKSVMKQEWCIKAFCMVLVHTHQSSINRVYKVGKGRASPRHSAREWRQLFHTHDWPDIWNARNNHWGMAHQRELFRVSRDDWASRWVYNIASAHGVVGVTRAYHVGASCTPCRGQHQDTLQGEPLTILRSIVCR